MFRSRDSDAAGAFLPPGRTPILILCATFCAASALAQDAFWQGEPYRGGEPPPVTLAGNPDAPLAVWSLRIAGSALRPRENNVDYTTNGSGGCVYATAGLATTVWNLPLLLPQGATVQYLRVYFDDTSASDLTTWFTVYDLYGSRVEEWLVSSSGAAGQNFLTSGPIDHVIDYDLYSYVVNFRPVATGSTLQLCGVRIFFTPPAEIFVDGFETGGSSSWSEVAP
jgi:hypothetical protein